MSEEKILDQIERIRNKGMCATTPEDVSYLKEKSRQELKNLLGSTLILIYRNQVAGLICIQPLNEKDGVASIGSFVCDQKGYGDRLFTSALRRAWNLEYREAVSVTASDRVKEIFEQYGSCSEYGQFDEYLRIARERYGTEGDLAQLFIFNESQKMDR